MLRVVLYQPEIPPNTGNVIRLCANTGAALHLIGPLGFQLDDRRLRRAGLDYAEWASVTVSGSLECFLAEHEVRRLLAFTTRATRCYTDISYQCGDVLMFGPETRGLPSEVLSTIPFENKLRLPMVSGSRSLNLSNTVAVALFEAWRQLGFRGAEVKAI